MSLAAAVPLPVPAVNPLAIPAVGSHTLRVLSPNALELTLVTTKAAGAARVEAWDFVDETGLNLPAVDQFQVTVDREPIEIELVGFKRRALYAPLNRRDLRIASSLYLQLKQPIIGDRLVEVISRNLVLGSEATSSLCRTDPVRWSPAIHVNQVGYELNFPKKAMVGYYLGSLGEMPVPTAAFQVLDAADQVVLEGPLTRCQDRGYSYEPTPYQQVWEADFSTLTTPGEYRIRVPGLGTSYSFQVNEGAIAAFARTYALGILHQRCGTSEDLPFTRFGHQICHATAAQVPDLTFAAVNRELASMSDDFARYQTAPQLRDCTSSLYPFVELGPRDVWGGHHDAGDYSKYTINSAGFIHFLVFAADAFPGVADLDNLGLPESGDGQSDILQEAKWESDFLARMQDADGGFYFLVYPRDREYEQDVLPDSGDAQVVFPKTTAVTAAAVAALAEAASSPAFRKLFPAEAELYLQKAQLGWQFLQTAMARHGKAGAYQKITHYGNEFTHDDELAWAACALFAATGDQAYHQQLKTWFDPADPNTRRWSWWRLFEGYGCAVRTYAFAARSGRVSPGALDQEYLRKCEDEILAAAADHVRFAGENAYGTSFPDPNKAYRSAGWYFSSERAFDITVAYQVTPRREFQEAVLSNLNYEGGANPLNMSYITGLGWQRQREIVHQYAQNDRRVLPPSGLPLGNIQSGSHYLANYQSDVAAVTFPPDSAPTAPYPVYDRWCDTFNTTTEFVITDQARSLASLCFWMAQTPVGSQAWRAARGEITGVPVKVPAAENVTATLVVPGLDLSGARVVWEGRDQEPAFGNPFTFAAKAAGEQWIEAEAQLPDGRRIAARTTFIATASLQTPPNAFKSKPQTPALDVVALFNFDGTLADLTGRQGSLTLKGDARLDDDNLSWMAERQGFALRCNDLGDQATVEIPADTLRSAGDTEAIVIESMILVEAFSGYNRDQARVLWLDNGWDAFLELGEDKYAGPYIRGGNELEWIGAGVTSALTPMVWHHLALEINRTGYVVRVDGQVVASKVSNQLANWGRGTAARLTLGNFAGWLDDVVVRSVRSGQVPGNGSRLVAAIERENSPSNFPGWVPVDLSLRITGDAGTVYVIECSPDLVKWIALSTNILTSNGGVKIVLPLGDPGHSFYRVRRVTD